MQVLKFKYMAPNSDMWSQNSNIWHKFKKRNCTTKKPPSVYQKARVPGLSIRDCAESHSNRGLRWPKLSATDLTEITICERLVFVSGCRSVAKTASMPLAHTPLAFTSHLFFDFSCLFQQFFPEFFQQFFPEFAPQKIVQAYFPPDHYTAPGLMLGRL